MVDKMNRGPKGFTLIEIMLVVIIIGTIAALMVPRLSRSRVKTMITTAQTETFTLTNSIDSFQLDLGRFPTTEEGLQALLERPASLPAEAEWDGPYLREISRDPWGSEYQYRYPGEVAVDFDIWSYGPDGQDGGDDDIYNVRNKRDRQ